MTSNPWSESDCGLADPRAQLLPPSYMSQITGGPGPGATTVFISSASSPWQTGHRVIKADDVEVDGVSLAVVMRSLTERLAILIPDPAKLEKYEALRAAYDHYLLLEKLCRE